MKHLEEANKNLINLRTSLITVVAVLTGGLIGIVLTDTNILFKSFLIILGIYFDLLFINDILAANDEIKKNIGAIKNECE